MWGLWSQGNAEEAAVRVARDGHGHLLAEVRGLYRSGAFCDVALACAGVGGAVVHCHRLVLAALSSSLAEALSEPDADLLVLEGVSPGRLTAFLDAVYDHMAAEEDGEAAAAAPQDFPEVQQALMVDLHWRDVKLTSGPHLQASPRRDEIVPAPAVIPKKRKRLATTKEEVVPKKKPVPRADPTPKKIKKSVKLVRYRKGIMPNLERGAQDLESKMDSGSGDLLVSVKREADWGLNRAVFVALLGVKYADRGDLLARPLAWSGSRTMTEADRFGHFRNLCLALRVALGLSEAQVKCNTAVRSYVGEGRRANMFKQRLLKKSEEELQQILQREDVKRVCDTKETSPLMVRDQEVGLSLCRDLPVEEVQGVAVLTLEARGVSAKFLRADESKKALLGTKLMRAALTMWSLRAQQPAVEEQDPMLRDFLSICSVAQEADVAREYLANRAEVERVLSLQRECGQCGKVFPHGTTIERRRFVVHQEDHDLERFVCGCRVTWQTLAEKRRHVLLAHREGFVQCRQCSFVGKPGALKCHEESSHNEMMCEYCSLTIRGKQHMKMHLHSFHPDKMDAPWEPKSKGTCPYCQKVYINVKAHVAIVHEKTKSQTCDICGKTFHHPWTFKKHRVHQHFPELLRIPCTMCDRRFYDKGELGQHMNSSHIGEKVHPCRYAGCSYSGVQSGNRNKHEKRIHGQIYTEAVAKGLMPPLEKKKRIPFPKPPLDTMPRVQEGQT